LKVNTAKKILGWMMLVALISAWLVFPDRFGGDYLRFGVLLATLGTLTLWISLVIFASWLFGVCGSLTRLVRKNQRETSTSYNATLSPLSKITVGVVTQEERPTLPDRPLTIAN
jgi:hypothetical protein